VQAITIHAWRTEVWDQMSDRK